MITILHHVPVKVVNGKGATVNGDGDSGAWLLHGTN